MEKCQDSPYAPIAEEDKPDIKNRLVPLMLEVPKYLFKSISGSLQIVSAHEFPHAWPELMPMLIERLTSEDPAVVIAILKTMSSVLKFYRNKPASDAYIEDILLIVKDFAVPLRELAGIYSTQFDSYLNDEATMGTFMHMQRLVFEIFLSLTSIDIPQQFADDLDFWMGLLHKFISFTTHFTSLMHGDDDMTSRPGELPKIQASAIRVLALFVRKHDEDLDPYIQKFLEEVWALLGRVSQFDPSVQLHFDTLVIEALSFLSAAITGSHHSVFGTEAMLTQLCTDIVIPNIYCTDATLDMFSYEPLDYIRLDLEGSDSHTRRRAAIELIKSMRRFYEGQVTGILTNLITDLLAEAGSSPDNWRQYDQAIYLVIALATTSQTRVKGVVAVNELVPLTGFFEETILPILEEATGGASNRGSSTVNADILNANPVVKADCLRFIISFRRQLTPQHVEIFMPLLVAYLGSNSAVVASYAAIALESYLTMKGEHRLAPGIVEPYASALFEALFARIMNPDASKFESENPYIGAAIARLIAFLPGEAIIPAAKSCLDSLTAKLAAIYQNPTNSSFVHCIFEGIAGIIGTLNKNNRPELCDESEESLLPAFKVIFEEDIMDLTPYVYQLMAQLIEARKNDAALLWQRYGSQFADLMVATHWERFANIPALTRLLSAYIRFAPTYVAESLPAILGIFQRVNDLKTLEKHAFKIILDIFASIDRSVWNSEAPVIVDRMCEKLREQRQGYQNQFIIFCSSVAFMPQLGPDFLVDVINSLQPGLFTILVRDIFIKHMGRTTDYRTVVAGVTCILSSPAIFTELTTAELWVPLLASVVNLATGNKDHNTEAASGHTTDSLAVEDKGGASDFAKLNFSGNADAPIVPSSLVPQQFLANRLGELSAATPISDLCGQLPSASAAALQDTLATFQVNLHA